MIDAFVTEMQYFDPPGSSEPVRVEPVLTIIRQPWYAALASWVTRKDWVRRVPVLQHRRLALIAWWYDQTCESTDLVPLTEQQARELEAFLPSVRQSRPTVVTRGDAPGR